MKNIIVFGAGAIAHLLSRIFEDHPDISKVYHYPANAAIQQRTKYTPLVSPEELNEVILNGELDMAYISTVEFQMDDVLSSALKKYNIQILNPGPEIAKLEWSKVLGKKVLDHSNIPIPKNYVLSRDQLIQQFEFIARPFVLKYDQDWRAGMQTVIITDSNFESEFKKIKETGGIRYMYKKFGNFVEQKFIIEEYIQIKREYSYHVMMGAKNWQFIGASRDYKKFNEGDTGFNTSGMGSYSPVPNISPLIGEYVESIWKKLNGEKFRYTGVMYIGVAEDINGKIWILEINTRQGDPEFQSIIMTYEDKNQFLDLLIDMKNGNWLQPVKFSDKHAVAVRLVNEDYSNIIDRTLLRLPLNPHINPHIWPELPGYYISLNTYRSLLNSTIVTTGQSLNDAADNVYSFLKGIRTFQFIYRKDIGYLE